MVFFFLLVGAFFSPFELRIQMILLLIDKKAASSMKNDYNGVL